MLEIDGSRYSGSGTIVRQAVAFAALTGQAVHLVKARVRRPTPGLRPQHVRVVEALRQVVDGQTEGVEVGAQAFTFWPATPPHGQQYRWDIGSAGSTTMLALAVLPVLAWGATPVTVDIRGGVFQDFAPSVYHLQHVLLPLVRRMGIEATITMERPGYVPRGGGILHLTVHPVRQGLQRLVLEEARAVEQVWGIALASHLAERRVSQRMAEAARAVLATAGYRADITVQEDTSALQPGAALALFADLTGDARLGADQAGAPRRRAEAIGRFVAQHLMEDLQTGATLDRYAADQVIPFAALAAGESRFRIPQITEHIESNAWLAQAFVGAEVTIAGQVLSITGVGGDPPWATAAR
jgi:RNA 3'-terminal phosphate cyclase (ATP)